MEERNRANAVARVRATYLTQRNTGLFLVPHERRVVLVVSTVPWLPLVRDHHALEVAAVVFAEDVRVRNCFEEVLQNGGGVLSAGRGSSSSG